MLPHHLLPQLNLSDNRDARNHALRWHDRALSQGLRHLEARVPGMLPLIQCRPVCHARGVAKQVVQQATRDGKGTCKLRREAYSNSIERGVLFGMWYTLRYASMSLLHDG